MISIMWAISCCNTTGDSTSSSLFFSIYRMNKARWRVGEQDTESCDHYCLFCVFPFTLETSRTLSINPSKNVAQPCVGERERKKNEGGDVVRSMR
jgi:hypothetical protein